MQDQPKLTEQEVMFLLCQALSEDGIDPSSVVIDQVEDMEETFLVRARKGPARVYYRAQIGDEQVFASCLGAEFIDKFLIKGRVG